MKLLAVAAMVLVGCAGQAPGIAPAARAPAVCTAAAAHVVPAASALPAAATGREGGGFIRELPLRDTRCSPPADCSFVRSL